MPCESINLRKRLVLSAVNIVNGGPLTILKSFLDAAQDGAFSGWEIIALVNPAVDLDFGRVKRINFAWPKRSWLLRVYYEYVVFKKVSRRLLPEIWLSLHDMTPNVVAQDRFVYCHNPAPFYKVSLRDALLDPKFLIFNKLYLYFYKININQNRMVLVQQQWMKRAIARFTTSPIHVSHPDYAVPESGDIAMGEPEELVFMYPAFPRVFKNHKVLCKVIGFLDEEIKNKIRIIFTISGHENLYARSLRWRYGHMKQICFMGHMTYSQTQVQLARSSGLLFPSKLETWGLPLTEAKHMHRSIVASNLDYARETVGDYEHVTYVSPDDPKAWAEAITRLYRRHGRVVDQGLSECVPPDTVGTQALLRHLVSL